MNNILLIGDTHFGHAKIAEIRGYPTVEEHDRDLIARWNAAVKHDDTVWLLGDVFLGHVANADACLAQLKGLKHLVMGNHDCHPRQVYERNFRKIVGCYELRNCLLTHIPVHPSQFPRWRLNIHGHSHQYSMPDPRYRCVSAEQTGMAPKLLTEVIGEST